MKTRKTIRVLKVWQQYGWHKTKTMAESASGRYHTNCRMRAQWVHRMLLPAGPNEALWRATPLYWANQALGVTTAADNILTADKPLSTSPLVVSAQDRDVPPQWQACFKSYGQVFVSQDTSEAPATALEVLAQPLFHNIRLAGPHGEPLATWTDCVSGRWQRWAANDIDRVEDLYDVRRAG